MVASVKGNQRERERGPTYLIPLWSQPLNRAKRFNLILSSREEFFPLAKSLAAPGNFSKMVTEGKATQAKLPFSGSTLSRDKPGDRGLKCLQGESTQTRLPLAATRSAMKLYSYLRLLKINGNHTDFGVSLRGFNPSSTTYRLAHNGQISSSILPCSRPELPQLYNQPNFTDEMTEVSSLYVIFLPFTKPSPYDCRKRKLVALFPGLIQFLPALK